MRNVLITGSSRGIGAAAARRFADEGFCIGICYNKSMDEAEKIYNDLKAKTKVHIFQADFSKPESVFALADKAKAEMGFIDVLVNNAGVSSYGLFQDVELEEFDKLININVKSAYFLTQKIALDMIGRKTGSIINVSSIWGLEGASGEVLYSLTKAALIGFTKALAKELAPSGIRVNGVAPGIVETDMMKDFTLGEKSMLENRIPLGKFAAPKQIADVIYYLTSEGASYITGQIISPNGGFLC